MINNRIELSSKNIKKKNNKAYDSYFFKFHKKELFSLLISFLFFIPTVLSIYSDCVVNNDSLSLHSILVFMITIFNCAWSFCQLKQEYNHIGYSANEALMDPISKLPEKINISNEQKTNGYALVVKNGFVKGRGLYSTKINKLLIDNVYDIEFEKKTSKMIRERIKTQKNKSFKVLNHHKDISSVQSRSFINESKLCLSEDIEKYNNKICCHRGCYYDTFLTNICCTKQYYNSTDMKSFFNGYSELFPINAENEITSISGSNLDNQIGISTIGLTSDNYLVIWVQNGHTQGDNMNASPSGSGSCDWRDRIHGQSFNEIIEYAMQRELWEESGSTQISKMVDEVGKTKLIGYFRWIEKGGKPEFLGVTRVNCMRRELVPNNEEVIDPGFDGLHYNSPKDLVALIERLLQKCQYNKYIFSLPLYMNLKCLYDFLLNNEPEGKIKWLFSDGN